MTQITQQSEAEQSAQEVVQRIQNILGDDFEVIYKGYLENKTALNIDVIGGTIVTRNDVHLIEKAGLQYVYIDSDYETHRMRFLCWYNMESEL